ncbi:hypothetical protein MMH89_04105 [Candidatus Comchoanobacter bicostacola]|uniref:Uncharacterized protein n=1 Tax=Candidatus Comchoanobacter bicostacola TaxID=2919598 RepID=A0ABY5DKQ2_9GAMM|nr:TrbI/VirB10 family protein [Candidatus Comchoanobacter bicostacola]UTC24401.1 hypothetical protein MMH89_04105 [Candidatus Comchoanobacter bicostacola]
MSDLNKPNKGSGNKVDYTRYSVIGAVVFVVLLVVYLLFFSSSEEGVTSRVAGGTNIESIPGLGDPSAEYSKLINEQNKQQAMEAERSGESSLPTLLRPQYSLDTSQFEERKDEVFQRDADRCSKENIIKARTAGVAASELKCYGCTLEDLKNGGYSASELRAAGFSAEELRAAGYSAEELLQAGFSVADLRSAGFTADELLSAGVSVSQLLAAGFTPKQLLDSGVSIADLRSAGVSLNDILASGILSGEVVAGGYCARGVFTALEDKDQVRSGGVRAEDLYDGGVTVRELIDLGYSIKEIASAGVAPSQLLAEGISSSELIKGGFSKRDVSFAEKNRAQIKGGVCDARYVESQMAVGVQAKVLLSLGCSPNLLATEGYKASDLLAEGVTPGQMKVIGYSASDLVSLGVELPDLVDACYDAESLLAAGFSAADLVDAGIPLNDLLAAGVSLRDLKRDGVGCGALYRSGVPVEDLFMMGCDASSLRAAGASISELLAAGYSVAELKRAGFSAEDMLKAGVPADLLIAAGYTPEQLLSAGFSKGALIRAGVNPDDLYERAVGSTQSGCDPDTIKQLLEDGISVKQLLDDGCSVNALLNAGVSVSELLDAGVSPRQLVAANVSAKELYLAGVAKGDLDGLFSEDELVGVGYLGSDTFGDDLDMVMGQPQVSATEDLIAQQERDTRIARLASAMQAQSTSLYGSWDQASTQSINSSASTPESYGLSSAEEGGVYRPGMTGFDNASYLKAGSIMYAVLDNDVVSTDPSPIRATIINGPLKGSKVLGEFEQNENKLVLKFDRINQSRAPRSQDISVFAVDVNTDQNVEIETHALLKYGSLFAASFLSGLNDVAKNVGTELSTTNNGASGVTTSVSKGGSVTQSKILVAGLGKVGENMVEEIQKFQDIAPTVRMKSGATFGLLIMDDFNINSN